MLPEVRVMSRPMLPLRAMFEFVALQQQESVSIFMAHITTKTMWMSLVWAAS